MSGILTDFHINICWHWVWITGFSYFADPVFGALFASGAYPIIYAAWSLWIQSFLPWVSTLITFLLSCTLQLSACWHGNRRVRVRRVCVPFCPKGNGRAQITRVPVQFDPIDLTPNLWTCAISCNVAIVQCSFWALCRCRLPRLNWK